MYRECLHHFPKSVSHDFLLSPRNWNEHYLCRCSDEIFKEKAICYASPFPPFRKIQPYDKHLLSTWIGCYAFSIKRNNTVFLQFDFYWHSVFYSTSTRYKRLCFRRSQKSVVHYCSFLGRGGDCLSPGLDIIPVQEKKKLEHSFSLLNSHLCVTLSVLIL